MPEDDTPSDPPHLAAPQYTPAPHLVKPSLLTAEELVSYYKDFYDTLKNTSCAPSLVFERLVANLIGSNAIPSKEPPASAKELEKCRDENKTLMSEIGQLKAGLATAQTGLAAANKELAAAQKDLAAARAQLASRVETRPDIGDFYSPAGGPKDIVFPKPYSAPPKVLAGMSWIHTTAVNALCPASYATDIRNDGFRIHCGESGNTVRSSWLAVSPNDPDIQCGTLSVQEGDPLLVGNASSRFKITFPRPYGGRPNVIAYFSAFETASNTGPYLLVSPEDVTGTGFTINISSVSSMLRKCTVSWVSCPLLMRDFWMGYQSLPVEGMPKANGYVKFGSGCFTAPPRVLLAITGVNMSSSFDGLKITVDCPMTDVNGFNWEVQANSSKVTSVGACFIAVG